MTCEWADAGAPISAHVDGEVLALDRVVVEDADARLRQGMPITVRVAP